MPPAPPRYLEVADQILGLIEEQQGGCDLRLPPERDLAENFGVHRETVRRALRHLRTRRRVYGDHDGTYAYVQVVRPGASAAALLGISVSCRLRYEAPPPDIAKLLPCAPGDSTLVHRRTVHMGGAPPAPIATTYLSPVLIAEVPRLRERIRQINEPRQPDLREIHEWILEAGLRPSRYDTPSRSRSKRTRRRVVDQHGRLLSVADLCRGGAD
ncbi:GntR family transcriptional regulator [Streptomyces sp. N35]|uniref:GntR family transcriptional regulator n=1 Tax=Streptomyces sp. N35 TaxID=2795730 RepID=UPI0018F36234|nr:GntR family transcriptional regulator [Streptomyces sp. N35]